MRHAPNSYAQNNDLDGDLPEDLPLSLQVLCVPRPAVRNSLCVVSIGV
jgi:hypothetical protein